MKLGLVSMPSAAVVATSTLFSSRTGNPADYQRAQRKQAPFDHARLSAALTTASGRTYPSTRLAFQTFTFNGALSTIKMTISGARWACTLANYTCRTPDVASAAPRMRRPRLHKSEFGTRC